MIICINFKIIFTNFELLISINFSKIITIKNETMGYRNIYEPSSPIFQKNRIKFGKQKTNAQKDIFLKYLNIFIPFINRILIQYK